ncbi:hypothetical protein PROFUN_11358 [Planoprotostelium fungivorum]|uniref:ADP/ATP translocase n=1 Tax=Planoprotostelium fungivorum TaxID=1890364 RepID=A0A2P6NAE2_9EUKA|nr:hypothetical protein PROFUN_11358 [Planoprotostelium fungivorum]
MPDDKPSFKRTHEKPLYPHANSYDLNPQSYYHYPTVRELLTDYRLWNATAAYGFAKTVTQPIYRLQLIKQTHAILDEFKAPTRNPNLANVNRYRGHVDTLRKIVLEQGFSQLWRGNMASIIRFPISYGSSTYLTDRLNYWRGRRPNERYGKGYKQDGAHHLLAAAAVLLFSNPIEVVHTVLTADMAHKGRRRFRGTFDTFRYLVLSVGGKSLYSGYLLGVIQLTIYNWQFWKWYPRFLLNIRPGQTPTFWERLWTASAVSSVILTATYPIDTVRRRLMIHPLVNQPQPYTNASAFLKICLLEGGTALMRGWIINIPRSVSISFLMIWWDKFLQRRNIVTPFPIE